MNRWFHNFSFDVFPLSLVRWINIYPRLPVHWLWEKILALSKMITVKTISLSKLFTGVLPLSILFVLTPVLIVILIALSSSLARTTFTDHPGTQKASGNPWEMSRCSLLSWTSWSYGSSRGTPYLMRWSGRTQAQLRRIYCIPFEERQIPKPGGNLNSVISGLTQILYCLISLPAFIN
jgi:hypothetical protein